MTSEKYSEQEKREWLEAFGQELRDGGVSEAGFRERLAIMFGCNATEIDQLVREALQPT